MVERNGGRLLQGDALTILKQLQSASVDCVVTSPPYWQLRNYGVDGQLGMEATIDEYVQRLCTVFDEVKRVLKPEGTCWINLGDSYSSSGSSGIRLGGFTERWSGKRFRSPKQAATDRTRPVRPSAGLPEKCLALIPFRFAIEMICRGWILRNVIIWHKPNCLPSSVRDRFTIDFDYVFFFVKSPRYYFERQFEPFKECSKRRVESFRKNREVFDPKRHKHDPNSGAKTPFEVLKSISCRGLNKRGRNKRCVWRIGVRGFPGAHFATFPPQLVETPIKAGCPKGGVVLDPFFGSGTTGLAAISLGRRYLGIELNPAYVQLAQRRLSSDPGQKV